MDVSGFSQEEPHITLLPGLEALLVSVADPVSVTALATALGVDDVRTVEAGLRELQRRTLARGAGFLVAEVATGWQLRTDARFGSAILALRGGQPRRLSRAALEVLAIVAYQQPATRLEIEEVRGVASGAVLKQLIDRGIVRATGRRDMPGKPLEYGTTPLFLELFSLRDLKGLPTLAEREALEEDRDGGP